MSKDQIKPSSLVGRRALLIGVIVFISCAYFYQGGGWNQNSRFDLIRAIVERRTLRIDAYRDNTGDRAIVGGHYYSDKAPGLSLLAVPIVATTRTLLQVANVDPESPRSLVAESYFATVFAVGLPAALACVCLFLIALHLGSTVDGAVFACIVMALGTPIWTYSTLFWGHALAGACLVFAFAASVRLSNGARPRSDLFWGLVIGVTAGWATVTEYPAAPASAILAVFALSQVWSGGWSRRLRLAGGILISALGCVGVLLAYQYSAFGSAFHPGYSYYREGSFPWMKAGYLGLTYPRVDVMWELLFGCRRGLLRLAPILAAAPFGLRSLAKQKPATRAAALAAAFVAAYYFLFNASFAGWDGGWSYGPRYMAAGIPLACIGLASNWEKLKSRSRALFILVALYGGVSSLIAVSTTAQPPDVIPCPLPPILWSEFWKGHLAANRLSMLTPAEGLGGTTGSFNLGQLVGLHGLKSLLPLLMIWGIGVVVWIRMNRKEIAQTENTAMPEPR
jgi:hypothetical protein